MPRSQKLNDCLKKAEAGDAKSQYTIGIQYENGNFDFPQDYSEAAKWYRRAAELGHAGAQLYLGNFLANGKGVEQDLVEAYKWVELAKRGNKLDKFDRRGISSAACRKEGSISNHCNFRLASNRTVGAKICRHKFQYNFFALSFYDRTTLQRTRQAAMGKTYTPIKRILPRRVVALIFICVFYPCPSVLICG